MDSLLIEGLPTLTVEESYARCARLARTHYENFTVVSWLLPRNKRRHLYAVYSFCRFVDDLGDQYPGDRLRALDEWERDLVRCYEGTPRHPYMAALQHTIQEFDIPAEPFSRLIQANRMDQGTKRHPTYEDLDFYCQHSANPVGHLVLYVLGYRDDERQRLSDYTCTALQLANFWQDVSRDFEMGRVYIPGEDMDRFGYTEEQLARKEATDEFRELMAFEVGRARDLFHEGSRLVDTLDGRLKVDVALFTRGGLSVLEAIERQGYDVLTKRPTVTKPRKLLLFGTTAFRLLLFNRT